jgi:hypothetical protein
MGKPTIIDHVLIDLLRHSSIHGVRSFMAAVCDTDQYLVVAEVREKLPIHKKSDKTDCNNYCWLSLLSTPYRMPDGLRQNAGH